MRFSSFGLIMLVCSVLLGCTTGTAQPDASAEEAAAPATQEKSTPLEKKAPPHPDIASARTLEQRLDDASIEAAVTERLVRERDLRVFDFAPVVVNGHLHLRGNVNTEAQAKNAARVAGRASGVEALQNDVLIRGTYTLAEADEKRASAPDVPSNSAAVYHTVQSGENLWLISRQYQASIQQIRDLNDLSRSSSLRPGQRLRVR